MCTILVHNFFLSLLLLIRCILSLSQAFLKKNNTELKIFGCRCSSVAERLCAIQAVLGLIPGGDQIFLILCCLKKRPVKEREYI